MRRDPLLALMAGKRKLEEPLAGKSTLNRLELTPAGSPLDDRYHKITCSTEALDGLLVDIFLESHAKAPRQIVLDLDVTDTPLYGQQEDRFFHGYYNEYCYKRVLQQLNASRGRTLGEECPSDFNFQSAYRSRELRQRWKTAVQQQ